MPLSERHIVITLVHGTWGKKSPWTKYGSIFRSKLDQCLNSIEDSTVEFHRFLWSGANRHQDRRFASIRLRKQLLKQLRDKPEARHYVVAHSHGGNIALRAVLHSNRLKKDIGGIVTVATPFLKFEQQSLFLALIPQYLKNAVSWTWGKVLSYFSIIFSVISPILILFLSVSVFIVVMLLYYAFDINIVAFYAVVPDWISSGCSWLFSEKICSIIGNSSIIILSLIVALIYSVNALSAGRDFTIKQSRSWLPRELYRLQARYYYSQPESKLDGVPILSLTSPLDEALGVLTGSWWIHRISGWLVRTLIAIAVGSSTLVAAVALYGAWEVDRHYLRPLHSAWYPYLSEGLSWIAMILFGPVFLLFTSWVVRLVSLASGYTSPGLGLSDPRHNLLLRVRAYRDAGPMQLYSSQRYGMWKLFLGSGAFLFHSRVYSYPPAIQDIANWIIRVRRG